MRGDRRTAVAVGAWLGVLLGACAPAEPRDATAAEATDARSTSDYCAVAPVAAEVLSERPSQTESPVDDVNWFARPVPHDGDDWIVAFATHDQNHLYNLTRGTRVAIPDRSDAVATPDGRYMTVPSYYTADSTVRFYPTEPLLERLADGRDARDVEPAYVHDHPALKRVYYQSVGLLDERAMGASGAADTRTYRMMFSGTQHESAFRIVDYRFRTDRRTGALLGVDASGPMRLCSEVTNDLNTPFISKDGRYVAAYTSSSPEPGPAGGASLKLFEITGTDPAGGTTTCRAAADFGFAAGKADFSFDNSMLTFHISQGAYLTPFVNGGLPSTTITDVAVAELVRDDAGRIVGTGALRRLTTSLEAGVGSYFPAFFPDGKIFYIANAVPRESELDKRFHFRVVDPVPGPWSEGVFESAEQARRFRTLASMWQRACTPRHPALAEAPFPLEEHEATWQGLAMTGGQCRALVRDAREGAGKDDGTDWEGLETACDALG